MAICIAVKLIKRKQFDQASKNFRLSWKNEKNCCFYE